MRYVYLRQPGVGRYQLDTPDDVAGALTELLPGDYTLEVVEVPRRDDGSDGDERLFCSRVIVLR